MSTIDSGLGWSCDSDYYVSDANTLVGWGTTNNSQYYKSVTGGALVAKTRWSDGFNYVVVMSTIWDNSRIISVPSGATITTYPYPYNGVTWYVTIPQYSVWNDGSPSDYPWIRYNNPFSGDVAMSAQIGDIVEAMISEANVQYTVDRIPTTNWVKTFVEGVEAETATRVNALDAVKQPKTMSHMIAVNGTWQSTVEGAIGAINNFTSTKISDIYANLGVYGNDVYGLQVDFENYIYTRLCGAVGKTAGTDFNTIAPWSGMKRCNVFDDGTIIAYYGDAIYTEDGSNGQVMVEIPKFYYRVVPLKTEDIGDSVGGKHLRKANYYISATKYEGFKIHPAFVKPDGTERDKAYISAYEGCIYDVSESAYILNDAQVGDFTASTGDELSSIANAKPASGLTQNLTRANSEIIATNRGTDWHCMDIKTVSALQWLFMIEYATLNSQSVIGLGVVDKTSGTGNEAEITGATSSLGNSSGMASGTNGLVSVSYRGVENMYGNVWKFISDVNIIGDGTKRGGEVYICNDYNYYDFPRITSNSVDIVAEDRDSFTVSVSASGNSLSYQWQFKRPNETSWGDFGEGTSTTLSKIMTTTWDGLKVRCKIVDNYGNNIKSGEITITLSSENKQLSGSVGGMSEYTINSDYYKSIGFTLPNSSNYISAFGYSEEFDWIFMPTETGDGASSSYPIGDSCTTISNLNSSSNITQITSSWQGGEQSGLFCLRTNSPTDKFNRGFGARLIYTGEVYFPYIEEENFES